MILRDCCPQCSSKQFKKNGHPYNGKQNHRCKACSCQFGLDAENRLITEEDRALIERLLRERLSLRGLCRAVGVSLTWLLGFVVECYEAMPDHLNVQLPGQPQNVLLQRLEVEANEAWSFVGKKANKQWMWLALDARSCQVIAFHVGDRSRQSAQQLWKKMPASYRQYATFHTDSYAVYDGVIPQAQPRAITKKARKTNQSNVLTARYGSGYRGSFGLRSRFPKRWITILTLSSISFPIPTWNWPEHYLCSSTLKRVLPG